MCAQYLNPPAPPTQWPVCPSSVAGAEHYTMACLLQNALFSTTQSQRGYGAIDPAVPIVSEGEKMSIESAKVRV